MAGDQTERRLTNRVLRVWKALASDGFPSRAQIDPTAFGADWSQCLMIDIAPELRRSRFSYVGSGLRDASWPTFDRQCLAECLDGSLLELVTRHVPRLLQANKPVTTGGQAVHEESNILYRTILLPLSESGHQVDGVLAAVGYREIAATPDIAVDVRPDLTVFEGSETRHVPRLLQANKPVTTGGQAVHEESNILYRTILLPLSESGHQVDGVLAAVGYREIAATADIAVDVRPDLTVFEGSETRQ